MSLSSPHPAGGHAQVAAQSGHEVPVAHGAHNDDEAGEAAGGGDDPEQGQGHDQQQDEEEQQVRAPAWQVEIAAQTLGRSGVIVARKYY